MSSDVRDWLQQCGAGTVRHPGGTLYAHLCRVEERLTKLGHGDEVRSAGLTHATYSTDGFDLALVFWQDRATLRELIGAGAEELVYLYGSCDRDRTWPRLAETRVVTDRFTGETRELTAGELTPFVDLSIVNELDVFEQAPAALAENRAYFRELFTAWQPLASAPVAEEVDRLFAESR